MDRVGTRTIWDHSGFGHHLRSKGAALHPQGGIAFADFNDPIEDIPTLYEIFRKPQDWYIGCDVYLEAAGTILSVDDPATDRMWRLLHSSAAGDATIQLLVSTDGSATTTVTTAALSSVRNRWVRVFFGHDGSNTFLYVDGEFGAASISGDLNVPASGVKLYLGGYDGQSSGGGTGAIKNLMVWDAVLNSSERAFVAKRQTHANSTWLPRRREPGQMFVVLGGGQSNFAGATSTPDNLSVEAFERKNVHVCSVAAKAACFNASSVARRSSVSSVGLETGLAQGMPHESAIIFHAVSGSNLHTQWAAGGAVYTDWAAEVAAGLADLESLGYTPHVAAIVWDQGTADMGTPQNAAAYEANLRSLRARMREAAGNAQALFVIVQADDEEYVGYPELRTVLQAQQSVAAERFSLLVTQDHAAKSDHVHRDYGSQFSIGQQIAERITPAPAMSRCLEMKIEERLGIPAERWLEDLL